MQPTFPKDERVRELMSLLVAHQIQQAVLCPGSRDIPLLTGLVALSQMRDELGEPYLHVHAANDERSAAFMAVGIAAATQAPCIVCCTSGSALLNCLPAVAEAYYRGLKLIVLSGDRPQAWIGQLDGQTLPQPEALAPYALKSVNLPLAHTQEDLWFSNRLINEALLVSTRAASGPVHINVPFSEPFFATTQEPLPVARVIQRRAQLTDFEAVVQAKKRWILMGQDDAQTLQALAPTVQDALRQKGVWAGAHMANLGAYMHQKGALSRLDDLILAAQNNEAFAQWLRPDVVVTLGGHVLSKRLKGWLRKEGIAHYAVFATDDVADTMQHLVGYSVQSVGDALSAIVALPDAATDYRQACMDLEAQLTSPAYGWHQLAITCEVIRSLPEGSILHLANSTAIRAAQYAKLPPHVSVYSNRGTNGIEGSMSAAIGCALVNPARLVYLVIGDLSYYYDLNSLWNTTLPANLRVVLINNVGGAIFHNLPGLSLPKATMDMVTGENLPYQGPTPHPANMTYECLDQAVPLTQLQSALARLAQNGKAGLLECRTEQMSDKAAYKAFIAQTIQWGQQVKIPTL